RALGQNYIGAEHLWLALLREGEGVAAHVLMSLGVDLEEARETILSSLSGGAAQQQGADAREGASATKTLDQFGRDLTQDARDGKLDPVIGRSREIERVVQILSRRTKNNPVLIGEP